jgi:Ca-activated chloride channel family protein
MRGKIALFIGLLMASAFAQPYLLVMDASGSMDEQPSSLNETKMDAAKRAASNFIDRTDGEIGLMVFDDCDSGGDPYTGNIQVVQGFTTNKASLKSEIDDLEPWSSTPIADSLEEAKTYISSTRGYGTIILITDGEETCSGDPVNVSASIYEGGYGQVHVIGYLIGGSAQTTAQEIAQAGGGQYYSVENADELEAALVSISGGDICCVPAFLLFLLPLLGFIRPF